MCPLQVRTGSRETGADMFHGRASTPAMLDRIMRGLCARAGETGTWDAWRCSSSRQRHPSQLGLQQIYAPVQVKTGTGEMRADAAVDRGNTLASWAELAAPAEAAKLLESAVASYSEALRQEEDAVVRSKLFRKLQIKLSAYLSQCVDLLLLPGTGWQADLGELN